MTQNTEVRKWHMNLWMQLNWLAIAEEIDDLYLGDAEVRIWFFRKCFVFLVPSIVLSLVWFFVILLCAYVEKVWRRASVENAGPLGGDFPIVTSDGHNILDVIFTTPIPSLGKSFYCNNLNLCNVLYCWSMRNSCS